MIPSFSYPGGKHYQRTWIISYFPSECRTYCEPFAGRANVFWAASGKINAEVWWLNDKYQCEFLRALRYESEDDLMTAVGETYPTHHDYCRWCSEDSLRSVVCEPWITFSGGGWGQGYRKGPKAPTVKGFRNRILAASQMMKRFCVRISGFDYLRVLSALGSDDFAYVDPPYIGCDVRSYRAADVVHSEMIKNLSHAKYRWVLSEYRNDIYDKAFGPPVDTRQYRLKVSHTDKQEERVEAIYRNY